MQNYKNLMVWQKGHQLTLEVYKVTKVFPNHELYGLTSQLRRASSSIPTNLSEGTGKLTDLDFRRYVSTAFGSSNEVEYLIFLAYSLNYMSEADFEKLDTLSKEVKKMLYGLISKLGKRIFTTFLCLGFILFGCIHFLI
ncbi:MAG TPA: four helix bundle protein [Saprospiraceae bacterium]